MFVIFLSGTNKVEHRGGAEYEMRISVPSKLQQLGDVSFFSPGAQGFSDLGSCIVNCPCPTADHH